MESDKLIIKQGKDIILIDLASIIFIEKIKGTKNTVIHTKDKKYLVRYNISELKKTIKDNNFVHCHRSYIINLRNVRKLSIWSNRTYVVHFKNTKSTALAIQSKIRKKINDTIGNVK